MDIGVGTGRNSKILLEKGMKVYGVDISEKMMERAKEKLHRKKIKFILADVGKEIPFKDNYFNFIICFRVLKYIPNWKKTIKEVSRTLKGGGIFLLEIPNFYSISYFGTNKANYYLFRFNEIKKFIKNLNFDIVEIKGGTRFPFIIYEKINNIPLISLMKTIERILDFLFPKTFLSRNILLFLKKK